MSSRYTQTTILLTLGFILLAAPACPRRVPVQRIVFNQGDYGTSGSYSELNANSELYGFSELGDDFVLEAGRSTINTIRWWGAYRDNVPVADDFDILVFADDGFGIPDEGDFFEYRTDVVAREMTDDLFSPDNWRLNIYEYTVTLPEEWELESDERYFLVIFNDTGKWLWSNNPTQGNRYGVSQASLSEWFLTNGVDLAFQLWGH